jgi:hypothetical protein
VLLSSLVLIASFLPCFPEQHKNPEWSGETKALRFAKMTSFVDEWVGICEIVKGCRTYGRVFFSLENLVLGYLDVEEFEYQSVGSSFGLGRFRLKIPGFFLLLNFELKGRRSDRQNGRTDGHLGFVDT